MTTAGAKRVRVHVGIQSLAAGGSGTFYVDDMFFKYGLEQNLMGNSKFEQSAGTTGLADGGLAWVYNATTSYQVVNTPVTSGMQAQKLTASNMAQGVLHMCCKTWQWMKTSRMQQVDRYELKV
ncbi:hypothetical protein LJR153_000611 [Paenibacillus sp. LjRoot153]|uniref:hypothetical protein n=1 Tax=Paenibacillus sp. LjRoot153 TaxID=3342270 RepID=UPI003ED041A3